MTDQPDRTGGDGLRAKLIEFDSFLNGPPAYEDKTLVRDYRHSAYAKWSSLCADIVKLIDTRATRDAAEGAGNYVAQTVIGKRATTPKPVPDTNCYTLPNGDCVAEGADKIDFGEAGDLPRLRPVPPKPAPDAMRKRIDAYRLAGGMLFSGFTVADDIEAALAVPVPSPDGTENLLTQLLQSGPVGNRAMAKYILSHFATLPSGAAAAELEDYDSEAILAAGKRLLAKQFPKSDTPPVRGDREPTPDMRIAGGIAWAEASRTAETFVDCADACWKAMWDAKP